MSRFSNEILINTSGEFRTEKQNNNYYVVGKGILIPVESKQKGLDMIERFKSIKD